MASDQLETVLGLQFEDRRLLEQAGFADGTDARVLRRVHALRIDAGAYRQHTQANRVPIANAVLTGLNGLWGITLTWRAAARAAAFLLPLRPPHKHTSGRM